MPKKPFFDKKKSVSFNVVHRSQRDPLLGSSEASSFVLQPVHSAGKRITKAQSEAIHSLLAENIARKIDDGPERSEAGKSAHTSEELKQGYRREDYELGHLGLPDDGYDYSVHLKEIGTDPTAVFIPAKSKISEEAGNNSKAKDKKEFFADDDKDDGEDDEDDEDEDDDDHDDDGRDAFIKGHGLTVTRKKFSAPTAKDQAESAVFGARDSEMHSYEEHFDTFQGGAELKLGVDIELMNKLEAGDDDDDDDELEDDFMKMAMGELPIPGDGDDDDEGEGDDDVASDGVAVSDNEAGSDGGDDARKKPAAEHGDAKSVRSARSGKSGRSKRSLPAKKMSAMDGRSLISHRTSLAETMSNRPNFNTRFVDEKFENVLASYDKYFENGGFDDDDEDEMFDYDDIDDDDDHDDDDDDGEDGGRHRRRSGRNEAHQGELDDADLERALREGDFEELEEDIGGISMEEFEGILDDFLKERRDEREERDFKNYVNNMDAAEKQKLLRMYRDMQQAVDEDGNFVVESTAAGKRTGGKHKKSIGRDLLETEVYEQKQDRFDAESIISTYSNVDNHPRLIKSTSQKKWKHAQRSAAAAAAGSASAGAAAGPTGAAGKGGGNDDDEMEEENNVPIRLVKGLPVDYLPNRSYSSKKEGQDAAEGGRNGEKDDNEDDDDDEEGEEDGDDDQSGFAAVPERRKDETAEEKKARKAAVKQNKKLAREMKKNLKDMFKKEEIKQKKQAPGSQKLSVRPLE